MLEYLFLGAFRPMTDTVDLEQHTVRVVGGG